MNIVKSVARVTLAAGLLLASASCTIVKVGEVHPLQGIVWRGDIVKQFTVNPTAKAQESVWPPGDPRRVWYARIANVRIFTGGYFKGVYVGYVTLPDSVEYSDLENGAIVDFIWQRGDDLNVRARKMNRIIRLVCRGSDKECIKRERSAGRVNTVIDPAPARDFMNGNTYLREVSPEEWAKYD